MKLKNIALLAVAALAMSSCDDYLDITPPSSVSPETYFTNSDQLAAYLINYYVSSEVDPSRSTNLIPSYGQGASVWGGSEFMHGDQGTDNEPGTNSKFFDGTSKVKVGSTGGDWSFTTINALNYFLEVVLPRYEAGTISGADEAVRHYIGECYAMRAMEYAKKVKSLGDFPIITECLDLDREQLTNASRRYPRNVVARFILANLDTAISYLSDGSLTGGRNRITRDVARLEKARFALYEATWEKYFAGTPFVPDAAAGWPGASKSYNDGFSYDNATEVNFFLSEAMAAAKEVINNHPTLTTNNKKTFAGASYDNFPSNNYYDLFAGTDPSKYDEALMYRSYLIDTGGHCFSAHMSKGYGFTQEFANCFLMANGLPIYDSNSGYAGDDYVGDTRKNRDYRWQLFTKMPNDYVYEGSSERQIGIDNDKTVTEYVVPIIYGEGNFSTSTGYHKSKGWSTNSTFTGVGSDLTAAIIYRSAEAFLIYIEAAWERYGDGLDGDAWNYWADLRTRAGLPSDPWVTINATDLDQEEYYSHDFGLYSAGTRITSKVLYNIRRERRCELMSEGMRWDDLIRWRSFDQLKTNPYWLHGCKIFGPMNSHFPKNSKTGEDSKLKYDQSDSSKNNVSSPSDYAGGFNGDPSYWCLLRVSDKSEWYDSGFSWRMAHYLNPIAEGHFLETSVDGSDVSTSPIYQNPYWSTTHDEPAQQ